MFALLAALLLPACKSPEQEIHALEPVAAVSPEAVDFGEVVVDYTGVQELEVINAGPVPLDVEAPWIEGELAFEVPEEPFEVPEQDRVTLELRCTPTTYTTYADTLHLETDDPDNPEILVPLSCTGVHAPTPDIDIDPLTLDFGEVPVGESSTAMALITNLGDDPLHIGDTRQEGSGAFFVVTDPHGATIDPGDDAYAIVVTYTPTTDAGDNGALHIESDDPDEPELTLTFLGNGGGDYDYPVAVIDAPAESQPLETVTLDGSESYDPQGYELTYSWTLADQPDGSTTELAGPSAEQASLFLDLAGDYEVQLVVENELGIRSAPAKATISAIPSEDLRVELSWDTDNTDIDLHLVESGYELFETPGDCNFCNQNPDWGTAGDTSDDPVLSLDDMSGYGPENINIDSPQDGQYDIYVHYYEDNGGGATAVTVRVYLDRSLAYHGTEVLERNQVWHVGTILWPERVVAEDESWEPYEPSHRGCY